MRPLSVAASLKDCLFAHYRVVLKIKTLSVMLFIELEALGPVVLSIQTEPEYQRCGKHRGRLVVNYGLERASASLRRRDHFSVESGEA